MENFIGTAALAIASGLAWLAYKHPTGYGKLVVPIVGTLGASFLLACAFDYGVTRGSTAIVMISEKVDLAEATSAADAVRLFGVIIYLTFLRYLPAILGLPKADEKGDEGDQPQ